MYKIDILLSTYNGQSFLKEQLLSILGNTYQNIRILLRDDGSIDSTNDIITEFVEKWPSKIIVIRDDKGNLGCTKSYEELVKYVEADYFMFSDQDDYWCSNKIAVSLDRLLALEKEYSKNVPCAVFTDLYVTDRYLNILHSSFYKATRLNPYVINSLYQTMAESVAPGCTMIMNRATLNYILPFPKEVTHDFWVILLTVKYGKVAFLNIPTIKYRQHDNNTIGIVLSGRIYMWVKLKNVAQWFKQYNILFKALPFRINYLKFIYWKLYYVFVRL